MDMEGKEKKMSFDGLEGQKYLVDERCRGFGLRGWCRGPEMGALVPISIRFLKV